MCLNTIQIDARSVGVGLKQEHMPAILQSAAVAVDFFEIHAENYFNGGGLNHAYLQQIRERYPISVHGTGLGLGNLTGLDQDHLQQLKHVVARYKPGLVSEHLSFNQAWVEGKRVHAGDLLPLRRNAASFRSLVRNITQVQDVLGQQLLLENISAYVDPGPHDMTEPEFLNALCRTTGCGLLVDLNNLYVNGENFPHSSGVIAAIDWLHQIEPAFIGQYHLAGSSAQQVQGLLIDDHATAVTEPVWHLYQYALTHLPAAPVIVEWDTRLPDWQVLQAQALMARQKRGEVK
jgi:hypothetical protein